MSWARGVSRRPGVPRRRGCSRTAPSAWSFPSTRVRGAGHRTHRRTGVDRVVDLVGAAYLRESLRCLPPGATSSSSAWSAGGASISTWASCCAARHVTASTLRARRSRSAALVAGFANGVCPAWRTAGSPTVHDMLTVSRVQDAHRMVEKRALGQGRLGSGGRRDPGALIPGGSRDTPSARHKRYRVASTLSTWRGCS